MRSLCHRFRLTVDANSTMLQASRRVCVRVHNRHLGSSNHFLPGIEALSGAIAFELYA